MGQSRSIEACRLLLLILTSSLPDAASCFRTTFPFGTKIRILDRYNANTAR